MSRPRVIDQNRILDAAETVVARDGAARLTLDAVAIEAGISKASVIYDYKSKQALIRAVIERKVARENARTEAAVERLGPVPNARIKGRIAASTAAGDRMQAVALNLCAALAQDGDLRGLLRDSLNREITAIVETSDDPRRALLAFLALEGLRLLELLGLKTWDEPQRGAILRQIESLAEAAHDRPAAIAEPPGPGMMSARLAPAPGHLPSTRRFNG